MSQNQSQHQFVTTENIPQTARRAHGTTSSSLSDIVQATHSALDNGHFEIVKFLVPQINDQSNRDTCCIKAAEKAADNGHFEIVKFVVSQINDQSNRD
ncbi:hypothetical protein BOX15_Mlig033350g2, partial [Macrostomum lignano]